MSAVGHFLAQLVKLLLVYGAYVSEPLPVGIDPSRCFGLLPHFFPTIRNGRYLSGFSLYMLSLLIVYRVLKN